MKTFTLTLTEDEMHAVGFALRRTIRKYSDHQDGAVMNACVCGRAVLDKMDVAPEAAPTEAEGVTP